MGVIPWSCGGRGVPVVVELGHGVFAQQFVDLARESVDEHVSIQVLGGHVVQGQDSGDGRGYG
jgi:hypothetical protein